MRQELSQERGLFIASFLLEATAADHLLPPITSDYSLRTAEERTAKN
jgi:hypothetical protein